MSYAYSMNVTYYTSPFSGKTYQVVPNTLWRQAWDSQGNAYKSWYTEYNFYFEDRKVTTTFSLDENCLTGTFGELEGAYAAWATSPRD
jgi:hypothetical protein